MEAMNRGGHPVMSRRVGAGCLVAAFTLALLALPARAETLIRLAWCGPVVTTAASPFAVAQKMGWFAEGGLRVQLMPLPGSADCVKQVATGDIPYAMPSIEPLALLRPQGVKAKNFYTAYQSNIYGLAVPVDSPIKTVQDLRGKTIGVTSMASAGVVVAKARATDAMAASTALGPELREALGRAALHATSTPALRAALRHLFGADALAPVAEETYAELRTLVARALKSGVVLDT